MKKARASRKAAAPVIPKIEEDHDMEEMAEEAQKPKKGRKNAVGGAKDEVSASASFLPDFRLTVRRNLRQLTPPRPKRTCYLRPTYLHLNRLTEFLG